MSARVVQEEHCVSDKVCGPWQVHPYNNFLHQTVSHLGRKNLLQSQPAAVFHLDHDIPIAIITS